MKIKEETIKICKGQMLEDWTEVDENLYYFKDEHGIVWQLLRTPFKRIPERKP